MRRLINPEQGCHCWAMTPSQQRYFDKMNRGDFVIFKPNGVREFKYRAEVIYKVECPELGDNLWGYGENWHLIYFLKNIVTINVDHGRLAKALGFPNTNPTRLPRFLRVAEKKVTSRIFEKFNGIIEFLESLEQETGSDPSSSNVNDRERNESENVGVQDIPSEVLTALQNRFSGPIHKINLLRNKRDHSEREHESIVESFYEKLGYLSQEEIRFRSGRIDVLIRSEGQPLIVNEVKKDWGLTRNDRKALGQAYSYANEGGVKYVVITNGDYYALFDLERGSGYESNFVFEFRLSNLQEEDLPKIRKMEKGNGKGAFLLKH